MNKEAEKKRLASIVFDGAPDWAVCAVLTPNGVWMWLPKRVKMDGYGWYVPGWYLDEECKNQPETELPWQDTLICRSDYE